MSTKDLTLLNRWRRDRDPEAFRELVARHGAMVYATCRRILGNVQDAEEITQDCFLQLAQRPARPKQSVGGWLHALAAHRALDRIKSDSRRRARERRPPEPAPERKAYDDLIEHVDAVLAELPEETRMLLVQHFLEGRSHEDIAKDWGVSRSTVTRRIATGVERMRERLRRRNVVVPVAALAAALLDMKAEALPAHITARLGKLGMAGAGASGTLVAGNLLAKVAVAAIALVAVGFGVHQFTRQSPNAMSPNAVAASESAEAVLPSETGAPESRNESEPPQIPSVATASAVSVAVVGETTPASGALVEGIVLDLEGKPVANARVDCYGAGRGFQGSTQVFTDDEGRFRFKNVPPTDTFQVYASTDSPKRRTNQQDLKRITAGERYDVVLTLHDSRVGGRVVDASGHPVRDAEVMAQPVRQVFHGIPTDTTDANGRFEVVGLAEGDYVLKANWPGGITPWPNDGTHVMLGPDEARNGFTLTINSEPGWVIAGRVTDAAGAGIGDAKVQANLPKPPYHSQWGRTNAEGYFAVEGLVEGSYRMTVFHSKYGQAHRVEIAAGAQDVNFTLEPRGGINGTVVDATTGAPLQHFELLEHTPVSDINPETVTSAFRDIENDQGRFHIDNVGPGDTPVCVRAKGYVKRTEKVNVPAGNVAEAVIALERGRTIKGLIVDASGDPIAGARVYAGKLPQGHDRQLELDPVQSDGEGRFELTGVSTEETLVTCYHPRYAPGHATIANAGTQVRIQLDAGVEIRGTITQGGALMGNARVAVIAPAWAAVLASTQVGDDGTFSLPFVPRDGVSLDVWIPGEDNTPTRYYTKPLAADVADRTVDVDIDVPVGNGEVVGTVYENGEPRGGLFMVFEMATPDDGMLRYSTHSASADGTFHFTDVPEGTGIVRVFPIGSPQEIPPVEVPVDVRAGTAVVCDVDV